MGLMEWNGIIITIMIIYIYCIYIYIYLGGGFNHLNNMKVNGKDYPLHYGK